MVEKRMFCDLKCEMIKGESLIVDSLSSKHRITSTKQTTKNQQNSCLIFCMQNIQSKNIKVFFNLYHSFLFKIK